VRSRLKRSVDAVDSDRDPSWTNRYLGADAYLTKPIDVRQLLETVGSRLRIPQELHGVAAGDPVGS
jgi:DNA-binding response OmpR family regulator